MFTTMHGALVHAIPMTDTQFALLSSIFMLVYGVANPIGGFLGDKIGRSRVIIVSMLAWSLLAVATGFVHSFTTLLVVRGLTGIAQACYIPAAVALIADYHPGGSRSLATGVHMTGITVGVATSFFGGWLADHYSISFAFGLVGVLSFAYAIGLSFYLKDAPAPTTLPGDAPVAPKSVAETEVKFWRAMGSLLSNWSYLRALVYWGVIGAVTGCLVAWMPTYMQERFRLDAGTSGFYANGLLFFIGIPGLILGGAWADRWSRTNRRAPIYVPVIGMLVAVPMFWIAGHAAAIGWVIANLLVWGVGNSFAGANMMPALCLIIDRRYRASAYGVLNAASAAVGGLTIYFAGTLRDKHVDLGPYLSWMGVVVGVCALLLLTVRTGVAPAPLPPPPPLSPEEAAANA
jgi:MFS family permease